ncbi:DUF502 domain-containing protein [Verrucomicrobium spinosum]|uniref:DUF502 domain-containing protein n=1 Tax=Verrucomicrobium spinosum TaxID=2736 RepID=UPI000946214B|nr:DUF502 domain-containing protein [Verrucomicrobium spinosum]
MAEPTPPPLRHPIIWVRNKFLAGLALVTPLVVTFWILQIVYATLKQVSIPLLEFFAAIYNQAVPVAWMIDTHDPRLLQFMNFLGFLIPIVFLVALGVMATNVLGVRVVSALEKFLLRIPLVAFIYKFMKQVMDSFKGFGGVKSFKRVVYVDYPSPGLKMLGFVTGQYIDPKSGAGMSAVLLPAALSPMTGLVIVTETSRLEDAPLTVEEAMKLIVSGGLISRKRKRKNVLKPPPLRQGRCEAKGNPRLWPPVSRSLCRKVISCICRRRMRSCYGRKGSRWRRLSPRQKPRAEQVVKRSQRLPSLSKGLLWPLGGMGSYD